MRLDGGTATHVGLIRDVNQDRCLFSKGLAVVADGMGGHAGGEIAASLAIAELSSVRELLSLERLTQVIQAANGRVYDASSSPELRGMGTTLVAASMSQTEGIVQVLNVGDSRCYLVSEGEIFQVTIDHSLVEDMVRQGTLDPEEARTHPKRNIVTRVLGIQSDVDVDTFEVPVRLGDRLVLCSDGLSNEVSDDRICELVSTDAGPEKIASALVEEALANGGRDNVTVVVLEAASDGPPPPLAKDEASSESHDSPSETDSDEVDAETGGRSPLWIAAPLILLGLIGAALFGANRYSNSAWYVSEAGSEVVIYNGRPGGVLFWDPEIVEKTGISIDSLDDASMERLELETVWPSLEEAQTLVNNLDLVEESAS